MLGDGTDKCSCHYQCHRCSKKECLPGILEKMDFIFLFKEVKNKVGCEKPTAEWTKNQAK